MLYSEIPRAQIVGMRNILVHEYFAINLDEIWSIVKKDSLKLKDSIKLILEKMEV